jgi:hypothetical protein
MPHGGLIVPVQDRCRRERPVSGQLPPVAASKVNSDTTKFPLLYCPLVASGTGDIAFRSTLNSDTWFKALGNNTFTG